MRARRLTAFVAATGLLVAACGGSSPADPAADAPAAELPADATNDDGEPAAGDAPAAESSADDDATGGAAQDLPADSGDGVDPTDDEDAPSSGDTGDTGDTGGTSETGGEADSSDTGEPADTSADTDEPEAPSDGCSVDGSPTALESAAGPLPEIAVTAAAAAASPLPEVAVRRINCDGGWVQLKNEIPADLPLLIWFWAPH